MRFKLNVLALGLVFSTGLLAEAPHPAQPESYSADFKTFTGQVSGISNEFSGEQLIRLVANAGQPSVTHVLFKVCGLENKSTNCLPVSPELRAAGTSLSVRGLGFYLPANKEVPPTWILSNVASVNWNARPALSLSQTSLNFGSLAINGNAVLLLNLRNTGDAYMDNLEAKIPLNLDFTIDRNSCGTTLEAGSSCSIAVRFAPKTIGPKQSAILISFQSPPASASGNNPQNSSVAVTGTAISNGVSTPAQPPVTPPITPPLPPAARQTFTITTIRGAEWNTATNRIVARKGDLITFQNNSPVVHAPSNKLCVSTFYLPTGSRMDCVVKQLAPGDYVYPGMIYPAERVYVRILP